MASGAAKDQGKTPPALTGPVHCFRVTLKQIARVHDIDATLVNVVGRASHEPDCYCLKNVVFSRQEPTVFQSWRRKDDLGFTMEVFGDDGRLIQVKEADFDEQNWGGHRARSIRCTLERQGWGHQWVNRTFDRSKSADIPAKSWVYVLRRNPGARETATLVKELQFDKTAKFRSVTPDRAKEKERWQPAPSAAAADRAKDLDEAIPAEAALDLPLEHPETGNVAEYYFYLARWRLPWDAVERLEDKPAYAVRLGDLFYTDVYESTDPKGAGAAEPLTRKPTTPITGVTTLPTLTPKKKQPAYVLHLVDPFVEASLRSAGLAQAVEAVGPAQNQTRDGEKYRLGKRIELFTASDKRAREIVQEKLLAYLYPDGGLDRINRILLAIHARAYDVIAWIGQPEHRHIEEAHWDPIHRQMGSVFEIAPNEYPPSEEHLKYPLPWARAGWANAYGTAVSFYRHADEELLSQVLEADAAAKIHLLETAAGQSFLEKDLGQMLAEDKELQKKLEIDPEALKKWKMRGRVEASAVELMGQRKLASKIGIGAWETLHAVYSNAWARKLRAFGKGIDKHGAKLVEGATSLSKLRRWDDRARGQLEQKVAKIIDSLGLPTSSNRSTGMKVSKAGLGVAGHFRAGLNAWAVIVSLQEADSYSAFLAASGEAFSALQGSLEFLATCKYAARIKPVAVHLAKPLGVFANVLEVGGKIASIVESHDDGERVGNAICLSSSLIAIAGATYATGGFALVIAGACCALDFIGKEATIEYKDSTRFLRACEFGDPRYKLFGFYVPLLGEDIGNKYKALRSAPLDQKKWTVEVQHQEVINLMYELRSSIRVDPQRECFVRLEPWFPHCFTADLNWSGYIDIVQEELNPTGPPQANADRTAVVYSEQILAQHPQRLQLNQDTIFLEEKGTRFFLKAGKLARTCLCGSDRIKVTGHVELTLPGTSVMKVNQDLHCVLVLDRKGPQDRPTPAKPAPSPTERRA